MVEWNCQKTLLSVWSHNVWSSEREAKEGWVWWEWFRQDGIGLLGNLTRCDWAQFNCHFSFKFKVQFKESIFSQKARKIKCPIVAKRVQGLLPFEWNGKRSEWVKVQMEETFQFKWQQYQFSSTVLMRINSIRSSSSCEILKYCFKLRLNFKGKLAPF